MSGHFSEVRREVALPTRRDGSAPADAAERARFAQYGARAAILATAQGAVGKAVDALTATERSALVSVLLWRFGAITPQATVAPLDEWAADPARG